MGFFCFGPMMHRWYSLLEQRVISRSMTQMMGRKLAADQGFFLPSYLAAFVVLNGMLKGDRSVDIKHTLKEDYWSMLKISYVVWIPAQMFNFGFLPLTYRVIFCNLVGLGWNTYLAYTSQ